MPVGVDHVKLVKSSVALSALMAVSFMSPAMAQNASEMAVRMQQLEEQVRQLSGQVEELAFEVKKLRTQKQTGALDMPQATAPATQQKRLAEASAAAPLPEAGSSGTETIEQQPIDNSLALQQPLWWCCLKNPCSSTRRRARKCWAPWTIHRPSLSLTAASRARSWFPPCSRNRGHLAQQTRWSPSAARGGSDAIETVALAPELPEALYERSNESLLRRQFGDAEAGFSTFLSKYPDHSLAGSAQYWLGETFIPPGHFKRAAQTFLQGYKKYPRGRRAADSL